MNTDFRDGTLKETKGKKETYFIPEVALRLKHLIDFSVPE